VLTGVADADVDLAEIGVVLDPVEYVPDVVVLLQVTLVVGNVINVANNVKLKQEVEDFGFQFN
jgi:hypothetical protein